MKLMLAVYVDNDEDARSVFDLLNRAKENKAGKDQPIPTLDWDSEWEVVDE